jgi:hypothetical protein
MGWSTTFWLIALALVVVTFAGSWMFVRVIRARRPLPGPEDEKSSR